MVPPKGEEGEAFQEKFFSWRRILLLFFFSSLSRRRKIALLPLTCYPPRKHIQEDALASAFYPLFFDRALVLERHVVAVVVLDVLACSEG